MPIKSLSFVLLVLLATGTATANPLTRVGVFILDSDEASSVPVVNQVDSDQLDGAESPWKRLKGRAMGWAREKAVYLNTHPFVGDPDLPEEYQDMLPHEMAVKMKEAFLRERRSNDSR